MKATDVTDSTVLYSDHLVHVSQSEWVDHPTFAGVQLKHVITGAETNGIFSSHIVKIAPNSCLDTHQHPDQIELHEVVEGYGECVLQATSTRYQSGKMAVIQKGESHSVQAYDQGLVLLAKFFPALI